MNNLRTLRHQRGWTQEEAAAALGTTLGYYAKLEYGLRRLNDTWIDRAAHAFQVGAGDIVSDRRVRDGRVRGMPVVGAVGARAEVMRFSDSADGRCIPETRWSASGTTVALEVRGDSLGPSFAGWFLIFDDIDRPSVRTISGRVCIVGLGGGRTFIKRLIPSPFKRSVHHLYAQMGDPITDVEVKWATPVLALIQP